MGTTHETTEPAMNNLPEGFIDWAEISDFIEDILLPGHKGRKGWKCIRDVSATAKLQSSSVLVLNILFDDLYGFFYKQHKDRSVVWTQMERYVRFKYGKLSEKALSAIITAYHIDDR